MALSERMRHEQAERARLARMLSSEELADCCGGCRTNSAIETWMQRAIVKFCEVNGIKVAAGVAASVNADLLAACKAAAGWLESWASAEPYLSQLRAAIARADGVQVSFKVEDVGGGWKKQTTVIGGVAEPLNDQQGKRDA